MHFFLRGIVLPLACYATFVGVFLAAVFVGCFPELPPVSP